MLAQERQNIYKVKNIIRNKKAYGVNSEDNILKNIHKQTDLSRSESKKFLDKYAGVYWSVRKSDDGIDMYRVRLLSGFGGK